MKTKSFELDSNLLSKIVSVQQLIATADLDIHQVMELIVGQTAQLTEADGAVIELAENEEMVYRAVSGSAKASLGARVKINASLSGICYRTGEIQECSDSQTDPRVDREACARIGVRSMVLVPLKLRERTIGVLKVLSAQPSTFTAQHIQILQMLSGLLGASLGRASDFEMIRERELKIQKLNEELETRILERTKELEESVSKVRALTESLPQMIWSANPDGSHDYFNEKWFSFTGLSLEQSVGSGWIEAVYPGDRDRCRETWEHSLKTGIPYEVEYRFRRVSDGQYRWHLGKALPIRDQAGRIIKWFGSSTDIEDQKASQIERAEIHANQRAAEAVRQSEARLRGIFESAFDAIVGMDSQGFICHWNPQAETIFGWPKDEVIGKKMSDVIIPAEYREPHEKGMSRFLRTKEAKVLNRTIETTALRRSGETFPIQLSISPVVIDDHYIFTAFIADISEKKSVQKQIEETQMRFQRSFEDAPIGMVIATLDFRIEHPNRAFCEMLGYSYEELYLKPFADITPEEDREISRWRSEKLLRSEKVGPNLEKRYIHKSGKIIWVTVHGSLIKGVDGQPEKMLVQVLDTTATKDAERSLKETTETLKNLIQASPLGIIAFDMNYNLNLWNPACEKLFGWKEEEVLGKPLPFVPDEKRAESLGIMQKMADSGQKIKVEADRRRRDGTPVKIEISSMPLLDRNQKVFGFMAILSDITERHQKEADLLAVNKALGEATRAKSEFLANMSHEIRTPINGVMGMASLLLDTELSAEQRDYVETIQISADTLLTLVNDILDLSKAEAGKVHLEAIDFDLEKVVDDVERSLSYAIVKKGLKLTRTYSSEIPEYLVGDPTRLGQVLLNLVNNAIKFTAQGGIEIDVQVNQKTKELCHVRFQVKDSGIGISQDVIGRMFQAFTQADSSTTRKFGGTGLGLSICKHLVQLMGGEIGVESVEGLGSTFWFTIPFQIGQGIHPQLPSESTFSLEGQKQLRVLVAEDNSVNQMIALKMLEKMGFYAKAVSTGTDVLEILQSEAYDLVLMDCQMPELDGYETTRRLREDAIFKKIQAIPIIAMTANAMSGDREKCLSVGMNDYISKPMKPKDLQAVIVKTLEKLKHKVA